MTIQPENTMNGVSEDVLLKIQKLLALGESKNQNESATAIAKATELLQRYNLDLAEVQGFGAPAVIGEQTAEGQTLTRYKNRPGLKFNLRNRYGSWIVNIARAIGQANMCDIIATGWHIDSQRIIFVGAKHQLPVVTYMFYSVFNQVVEMMRQAGSEYAQEYMKTHGVSPAHVKGADHIGVFTSSWLEAAVSTICDRLESQTQSFKTEQRQIKQGAKKGEVVTGKELMVVASDALNEYYKEHYPWRYKAPPQPVKVKTPEEVAEERRITEEWMKKASKRRGRRSSYTFKVPKEKLVNRDAAERGREDGQKVTFARQGLKKGGGGE